MNTEEIKKLAELSRLSLSDTDIKSYNNDFEGILNYINTIKGVSVDHIDGHAPMVTKNVLREDAQPYEPGVFTDELLSAAPEIDGNYIKVKKVL